jgi:hypothetical protein
MPVKPIAWTRSSTRRVETPPIQASWMTATSAFSLVLRGSRKGGKYEPWRSFGMRSWSGLQRVDEDENGATIWMRATRRGRTGGRA